MRHTRTITTVWTVALLLSAAAIAEPSTPPIHLTRPAASASEAVKLVAAALRGGDPADAVRLARLGLDRADLSRAQRSHVLLNRALARQRMGERLAAAADFTLALKDHALSANTRARALFDRGIVLDEMGDTNGAITDYNAALKLVPKFPAALNNRANALRRLGRYAQARRDYEASLAAGNTQPQYSNYGLGRIAEAEGNPLAARAYYRQALKAAPNYGLVKTRLAVLSKTWQLAAFVLHPPTPTPTPKPVTRVNYQPDAGIPSLRPAILGGAPHHMTARIQLGAYRAEGQAADGWNHLVGRAGGLLSGLTPQIVSVDLPGRGRYWRLRAGPMGRHDAHQLCAQLKSRGLACMPVRA
jgi:tetratricopeptide (TPR) repeat protein